MADRAAPKPPPSLQRFYRVGLLLHTAAICTIAACAYAGMLPSAITVVPHYDTITHFLLVGMFGFFLDGALAHRPLVRAGSRDDSSANGGAPSRAGLAFVPRVGTAIALALATTEEIAQRLSPRRSSTWSDFAANTTGILICSWLALRLTTSAAARHALAPRGAEGGAA